MSRPTNDIFHILLKILFLYVATKIIYNDGPTHPVLMNVFQTWICLFFSIKKGGSVNWQILHLARPRTMRDDSWPGTSLTWKKNIEFLLVCMSGIHYRWDIWANCTLSSSSWSRWDCSSIPYCALLCNEVCNMRGLRKREWKFSWWTEEPSCPWDHWCNSQKGLAQHPVLNTGPVGWDPFHKLYFWSLLFQGSNR